MPGIAPGMSEEGAPSRVDLLLLHVGTLIIATSAVLGRSLQVHPTLSIFWRCVLGATALWLGHRWWSGRGWRFWPEQQPWMVLSSGLLLSAHWVTYFFSLRWGGVAVGILSLYTYPALTVFIEGPTLTLLGLKPTHTRIDRSDVWASTGVLLGVGCIALGQYSPGYGFAGAAFGIGLVSAILYALRNILSAAIGSLSEGRIGGGRLMFYQLYFCAISLSIAPFVCTGPQTHTDVGKILFLGLVTTAIGHSLFLGALRIFRPSFVAITGSLLPLYAIGLGILFLGEWPNVWVGVGGSILLLSVATKNLLRLGKVD